MESKLLSIFIPTYNRAHLIGDTLDEFINQIGDQHVTIIISDNCSTDNTFEVVQEYVNKYPFIRYSKNTENIGFDGNVVKMANLVDTKYCWLFGDDDVIKDNALNVILNELKHNYDLIVVNASLYNLDLSKEIEYRHLPIISDKYYYGNHIDNAFLELSLYTSFIGSLVVKRELWEKIDYKKYLKTGFVHVGIVYEYLNNNSKVLFVSNPLINIRLGNSGWSKNSFEIWYILWVKAINQLPNYSNKLKRMVYLDLKDISLRGFIMERAKGSFRMDVYKRFIEKETTVSLERKIYLRILLLVPTFFLKTLFKFYLLLKKPPSYKYQLFELESSFNKEVKYL